jgi:hypothetical protein
LLNQRKRELNWEKNLSKWNKCEMILEKQKTRNYFTIYVYLTFMCDAAKISFNFFSQDIQVPQ